MAVDEFGMDDNAKCGVCGETLEVVRPGKYQCNHCESEPPDGLAGRRLALERLRQIAAKGRVIFLMSKTASGKADTLQCAYCSCIWDVGSLEVHHRMCPARVAREIPGSLNTHEMTLPDILESDPFSQKLARQIEHWKLMASQNENATREMRRQRGHVVAERDEWRIRCEDAERRLAECQAKRAAADEKAAQ